MRPVPDTTRPRQEQSLRTLLTLATFVLSALGASGLAALRSEQVDRQARTEAGELNLQQAAGVAAAVDTDLGRFGSELLAQSQLIEEGGALRQPGLLQALMNGMQALPSHAWVGVTNLQGKVLAASAGRLVGMNVSGREWWGAAQEGLYYGDVHEAVLLERLLPALQAGEPWRFIDLSAPLREDGRLAGVVAMHLSWPWLRERIDLFARAIPTRDAQLFIVGRDGRQRLGPVGALGDALPLHWLADEAPRGWRVQRWPDGHEYVTAWAANPGSPPFTGFGWVTLVRTPLQALDLAHAGLHRGIWTAAALAVLLATALAWLLSSLFQRLLDQFLERVQRIAEGAALPPRPPQPRRLPAELARLDDALQALMGRLHGQAMQQPPARAGGMPDLSSPDDGGTRLRHEVFELPALLDAVIEAMEPQARRKHLALRLDLSPVLPPRLRGDAFQLRRLLLNLLAHVLRITGRGDVRLRLHHAVQAPGKVLLQVQLSGSGIEAAEHGRIGEDAGTPDGAGMRHHAPTGLGLARMQRLVALMGGTLSVESEPDRGGRFRISLPFDLVS